ncbi:MAG: DUF4271 domain-containing protein [Bacteroidia bacterium]|nr:DUF4271 domain-containing protein [Bacteroidia bacterium]
MQQQLNIDSASLSETDSLSADSLSIISSEQNTDNSSALKLFTESKAETSEMQVTEKISGNPDWIVFIILLSLVSLIFVRVYFYKVFAQIGSNILRPVINRSAGREDNVQIRQAFLLLSFNFYIIGGLFLYLLSIHFEWSAAWMNSGFIRYMIFTLLLAVIFPLKILGIRTLGFVFDRLPLAETYVYNIQLTNNTLGLLLIPITAIFAYVNWEHMSTLVAVITTMVIVFLFAQVLKGVLIWSNQRPFSLPYLILYLCTLEIAPLLVVCKLASF